MIENFSSAGYQFLSNFAPAHVMYEGKTYPTVEHAFQAAKTFNEELRERIRTARTPANAKRLGGAVTLRDNWDFYTQHGDHIIPGVKFTVMEQLLRQKFASGSQYAKLLIATHPQEIIEGNYWHDNIWGRCNCPGCLLNRDKQPIGQNHLGKLLMKIRAELLS